MKMQWITFRSITPAQRAQRVLRSGGIEASLRRMPREFSKNGCGYGLFLAAEKTPRALRLLREAGIAPQAIRDDGRTRP